MVSTAGLPVLMISIIMIIKAIIIIDMCKCLTNYFTGGLLKMVAKLRKTQNLSEVSLIWRTKEYVRSGRLAELIKAIDN